MINLLILEFIVLNIFHIYYFKIIFQNYFKIIKFKITNYLWNEQKNEEIKKEIKLYIFSILLKEFF